MYSIKDVGGYPTAETFLHSTDGMTNAEHDTDRDGMLNVWEAAHGLDPDDPADGTIVSLSAEDYINVEMYLNELIGDPVDGTFNIADVVALQKWLLAVPDTHLASRKAADLCEDEKLDAIDLCIMKRNLLQS